MIIRGKVRILAVAFTLMIMLAGCRVEKVDYYTGTVEGDKYAVMTSVSGEIEAVYVKEGDRVEEGQKIAQLDTDALEIEKMRLEAVLEGAQADLRNIANGAREEEINQIYQQIAQQEDQIGILKDQYNHVEDAYVKMTRLFESGAASQQQKDDAKLAKGNAALMLEQARAQKKLLDENLALVLEGATEEELLSAKSRVESAKWAVAAVEDKIQSATITAKHSGTIETVYLNAGEQYAVSAKIADIVDLQVLNIRIYVEEKNLQHVKVGDAVLVKVDYDSTFETSGIVEFIASEGEFTPKNLETKENRQEVVYEVRIRLEDTSQVLKPGMLVDAYLGDDDNE